MTLTGTSGGSTTSDVSGTYAFTSLVAGGTYTVTPTKAARALASAGINTIDAIAVQRHFLIIGTPLSGCPLAAADTNGDSAVNTIDAIAIQRFFLASASGTANVGQYQFTPVSRTYSGVGSNQTAQNYDVFVLGDVVSGFVERPEGPSQNAPGDMANEVMPAVAKVALPNIVDTSKTSFTAEVVTSPINPTDNLIGFQGDVTFDSTVITFESDPVQKAGLTSGNWNVSGNVLDGPGPIRTLRISAFSNDFEPLAGSGVLFKLRVVRVGKPGQVSQLFWAAPPDHFIFIDADLKTHQPGYSAHGSVISSWGQKTKPPQSSDVSDDTIPSDENVLGEENEEIMNDEHSVDE